MRSVSPKTLLFCNRKMLLQVTGVCLLLIPEYFNCVGRRETGSLKYNLCSSWIHICVCVCVLTGEALTQSSLLEADGENMTTAVEPMDLHHAMLRPPGRARTHRAAPVLTTTHDWTVSISGLTVSVEENLRTPDAWCRCAYGSYSRCSSVCPCRRRRLGRGSLSARRAGRHGHRRPRLRGRCGGSAVGARPDKGFLPCRYLYLENDGFILKKKQLVFFLFFLQNLILLFKQMLPKRYRDGFLKIYCNTGHCCVAPL